MDLNELAVFAKVVDAGSFVGAARALDLPKSTVSRRISDLETRLGARLLQRTTRRLSLTDVGHLVYEHAARAVSEAEAAEQAVGRLQSTPQGLLRVTAPLNFGYLQPIINSFLSRFPDVQLEMVCTDRMVDLVDERFDVAIRAGSLPDSSLVARNLGVLRRYLVASPQFLDQAGVPAEPQDLARLPCLVFGAGASPSTWVLQREKHTATVRVTPRMTVNDFDFLDEAARHGLGVAQSPGFQCISHLRAGRLVRVLPTWSLPETPIHAVYPHTRHLAPKVRAFLDHLRDAMTPPPWELGPPP